MTADQSHEAAAHAVPKARGLCLHSGQYPPGDRQKSPLLRRLSGKSGVGCGINKSGTLAPCVSAAKARKEDPEIHMGKLFGIRVDTAAELPRSDPRRKYKYRAAFQGDQVVTQKWDAALFQKRGSSPATMGAGKAAACLGCAPGNDCEPADAEQAYVQANLKGNETWVALPPEAWPDGCFQAPVRGSAGSSTDLSRVPKYHRLVVLLNKALYGHPDAGTFWEQHCDKAVAKAGFEAINTWPSCFFNRALAL